MLWPRPPQIVEENAPTNALNPVSAPRLELNVRQNLLQGFGIGLNNRGIRIADVNRVSSKESFRSQLLNLVVSVLNLYWDYVGARDQLKLRERALSITEKFRDDTKYEISVGALAGGYFQAGRTAGRANARRLRRPEGSDEGRANT